MAKDTPTEDQKPMRLPSIPVLLGVICALILVIILTYLIGPEVPSLQLLPQISPPLPPPLEGVTPPLIIPSPPVIAPGQPPPPPALP